MNEELIKRVGEFSRERAESITLIVVIAVVMKIRKENSQRRNAIIAAFRCERTRPLNNSLSSAAIR